MYIIITLDEGDPLFPLFTEMQTSFRVNEHAYTVSIIQRAKTHILISGRIEDVILAITKYISYIDGDEADWRAGLLELKQAISDKRAELYHTMTGRHLDVNA